MTQIMGERKEAGQPLLRTALVSDMIQTEVGVRKTEEVSEVGITWNENQKNSEQEKLGQDRK